MAQTPKQEQATRDAQRMGWLYATAINFAASVAVFTVGGYFLDRWLKTAPWCLISGLILGLVGGTIKFIRDGLAVNREVAAETRGRHDWRKVEPDPEPEGRDSDR
jgi:F0F1-type ATP synthase assembly protein I